MERWTRRPFVAGLLAAVSVLGLGMGAAGKAAAASLPLLPGDVFVTRNPWLTGNQVPGFFNHAAIYEGNDYVLEGRTTPGKILRTKLNDFINQNPVIRAIRLNDRSRIATQVVYARVVSSYPANRLPWRTGFNSVQLIRQSYLAAYGMDPGWNTPTDIFMDNRRFSFVGGKG